MKRSSLRTVPKRLVLVGGGVIGLELGTVYQKLGAELTVVELMDQILPGVDRELVNVVEKKLAKGGAKILTKAKATKLEKKNGIATITIEQDGKSGTMEADKVLVAVGFKPNSGDLDLNKVGVKTDDRGHILVDERFSNPHPRHLRDRRRVRSALPGPQGRARKARSQPRSSPVTKRPRTGSACPRPSSPILRSPPLD